MDPAKQAIKVQLAVLVLKGCMQRLNASTPTDEDKEDLQRFIGLINYLAACIPHFADKVSPLRELLKKDFPFV